MSIMWERVGLLVLRKIDLKENREEKHNER